MTKVKRKGSTWPRVQRKAVALPGPIGPRKHQKWPPGRSTVSVIRQQPRKNANFAKDRKSSETSVRNRVKTVDHDAVSAVLRRYTHRQRSFPHSSSASRFTAGASAFFILSQSGDARGGVAYALVSSRSPAIRSYSSFALLMRYSYSRPLCGSCLITS